LVIRLKTGDAMIAGALIKAFGLIDEQIAKVKKGSN